MNKCNQIFIDEQKVEVEWAIPSKTREDDNRKKAQAQSDNRKKEQAQGENWEKAEAQNDNQKMEQAPTENWEDSLLRSMEDPSQIVYENEEIVIILDKYPKAREHYMVLPRQDIRDIYSLRFKHLPLLRIMQAAGLRMMGDNPGDFMM